MTDDRQLESLGDRIADASSVLLLAPSLTANTGSVCAQLLAADQPSNILWIAYGGRPDRQLERWETHGETTPANAAVITISEGNDDPDPSALPFSPRVESIGNPGDLTGLGIHITELLREWETGSAPTRVCFDSITAMLQYVDFETAYEFLHVVSGRTHAMGAMTHFHLDPGAHDEQTIESVATLCDAVVEISGDSVDVRTR